MITLLALCLISLAGILLMLTSLVDFSRSRLEKYCEARSPEVYPRILENRSHALDALRVWSWLFGALTGIAMTVYLLPTGDEPATTLVTRLVIAALVVVAAEVWILRPVAHVAAEAILYNAWPFIAVLQWSMLPVLWITRFIDRSLHQLFGLPYRDRPSLIQEELLAVVSMGESIGTLDADEASMIEGLVKLKDFIASEVMTPRTDMVMLPITASLDEARATIRNEGHSRIPVFGDDRDDIMGVLYAKDLVALDPGKPEPPNLSGVHLRDPVYVPESKPVPTLLEEFRHKRIHMAIVLDEYGGVAGLVTIEDILEEIVGEIVDEYDDEPPPIRQVSDTVLEVEASVHVDELNDEFPEVDLPENEDYDTIGGFLFSSLGRIPKVGESFRHNGVSIQVLEATDRKINRVRIELIPVEAAGDSDIVGPPPPATPPAEVSSPS